MIRSAESGLPCLWIIDNPTAEKTDSQVNRQARGAGYVRSDDHTKRHGVRSWRASLKRRRFPVPALHFRIRSTPNGPLPMPKRLASS